MQQTERRQRVVIMGAAGRDFHNFNTVYRDDPAIEVVAFTATQIPGIDARRYPSALAGPLYPDGIPIRDEAELAAIVRAEAIDTVVFAYSDVEHATVMQKAAVAMAAGADFALLGPRHTMLRAKVPVIAVSAVRTGCGKSQTTRWISSLLRSHGLSVVAMRHPMPYGDLARQAVQRFANVADLDAADCTIEEREEYEPHIANGMVVYTGADYARILEQAEEEAQVILWDGGNNDFPFLRPNLHIVLVDPLRPGHEATHHPGETVLRMADIVLVAKSNAATAESIELVTAHSQALAPTATVVRAASLLTPEAPDRIRGARVIVVDDGPTLTHGGMPYGAGYVAAVEAGASEIVDPRPAAVGSIAEAYDRFPHLGKVLPALGYSHQQLSELEQTINASGADLVVSGTPSDLNHLMKLTLPIVRVRYDYADAGEPRLGPLVERFLAGRGLLAGDG